MHIKLATTEAEFEQVYQIRYQCLTLELGDESYANHLNKIYLDDDDAKCQHIFVAYIDNNLVGTARLLLRKEQAFIADEFYDFASLAHLMEIPLAEVMQQAGLIDRVCVLKDYRGHKIFSGFYEHIRTEMLRNECSILLAAIQQENIKSQTIFSHFGFHQWNELKVVDNWRGYLYYNQLAVSK